MVPFSCSSADFVQLVSVLGAYLDEIHYDPVLIENTRMRFLGKSDSGDLKFDFYCSCPPAARRPGTD